MKMAFIVHNEYFTPRVMHLLREAGIDYYTRWEHAPAEEDGPSGLEEDSYDADNPDNDPGVSHRLSPSRQAVA